MFWLLSRIAFIVAAFLPAAAFAGYAQLAPPPAFQSVGGVSTMNVGAAANGARYAGGHVMANASLNLGARVVTVPVAMRVAANAATFAVTKLNPWLAGLQLATLAIPYIVEWFQGSQLEVTPGGVIQVKGSPGTIFDPNATRIRDGRTVAQAVAAMSNGADIVEFLVSQGKVPCEGMSSYRISGINWIRNIVNSWCMAPTGMPVYSDASPTRPATEDDLSPLTQAALNPQALAELGLPLPVDPEPVVNPAAEPVGDIEIGPNGNPAPQLQPNPNPLRYPNGNPVPIPNTNPQTYSQPWWEVEGAPTPAEPWRVTVRPVVTETTSPDPQTDPDGSPVPDPEQPPIPDFYTDCEKYPGSLGCAAVGDPPAAQEVPKLNREFLLQAGPSFTGYGCPANLNIGFGGQSFQVVDMAVPCSWIENLVKPIFLLLSFVSAVFIVRSAL